MRKREKRGPELTRRDVVVGGASLALLGGLGSGCSDDGSGAGDSSGPGDAGGDLARDLPREASAACDEPPTVLPSPAAPAPVVEVYDPQSVTSSGYDAARVKAMLQAGIKELGGSGDLQQAWAALLPDFSPSMRIGIKVNCLNANLYNSGEVLLALIETLTQDLGAAADRLWVWDRRTDELSRSKMSEQALKVKVAGTVHSTSDSSGPGYETAAQCVIDRQTHLSRILTSETDVTINLALLKTHNISGITGALKNVYGCVDNPGSFHAGFNSYMPALYRLDRLRAPLRLHITEGLKAVTKGDTTAYPDSKPARLLLAQDPVALDAHALQLVNTLRTENPKLQPLPADKVAWLQEAARLGVGTDQVDARLVTMP